MELHPLITLFIISIPEEIALSYLVFSLLGKKVERKLILATGITNAVTWSIIYYSTSNLVIVATIQIISMITLYLLYSDLQLLDSIICTFCSEVLMIVIQATLFLIITGFIPKTNNFETYGLWQNEFIMKFLIVLVECLSINAIINFFHFKNLKIEIQPIAILKLSYKHKLVCSFLMLFIYTFFSISLTFNSKLDIYYKITCCILILATGIYCLWLNVEHYIDERTSKICKPKDDSNENNELIQEFEESIDMWLSWMKTEKYKDVYDSMQMLSDEIYRNKMVYKKGAK